MDDTAEVAIARRDPRTVRWPQVAILSLLQSAIGLSWLVYALFLPALVLTLGFDASLAATLLLVEGVLAALLEPAFGFLSDKTFRRIGSRMPFVIAGVFLAAALFVSIPLTVVRPDSSNDTSRLLFLCLVIGWAIAMTVFRTPAISLLSRYASSPNLPRAASVLTLLAAGVAALRPVSRDFLLSLGPVLCFGVASLVLLGSCAAVWLIDRAIPLAEPASAGESPRLFGAIVTLFASGAGLALAQFALLTQLLPRMLGMLPRGLPELSALTAAAMLYFGACALGAGAMARRLGNERTMLIGAGASTALIAFLAYVSPTPALLVGLIALTLASFSLVANGMIPLALGRVSTDRGGLGLGFYFGGLSATSSVVAFRFRPPVSVGEATTFALIGLALVASAVWAGRQPPTGRQATTRP